MENTITMLIWLALLIPIIFTGILYFKYDREITKWELAIPVVVSFFLCLGSKALIEKVQTDDTEYWSGYVTHSQFFEEWNEKVSCRHTKYKTDRKGNRTFAGYEHSYDVDYHPPQWYVTDSNNITISVDSATFEQLCHKFGNRTFHNLGRHYHTINGNEYRTVWPNDDLRLEPMVTAHTYQNRIKVSNSVFKFQDVDPKKFGLFEYPKINNFYNQASILGDGGITQPVANQLLNKLNAKIGATKQVRIFILVFKNQPLEAGFEQECHWKGGNKNEFVITLGVNDQYEVQWCHPFSWTEEELLKIQMRDYVTEQKVLNLEKLVVGAVEKIQASFRRKHFKDFNYLTVEPPAWAVGLTYLLTLLVNIGVAYWAVNNDFKDFPLWNLPNRMRFKARF